MRRIYSSNGKAHLQLKKLFSAMADLMEKYDSPPEDTCYWYGERALTGLLSSAAWSLPKSWSLEEFTGLRVLNGKKGNGKGDIWIGVGKHRFTIEAKAVWPGSSVVEAIKGVKKKLAEAVSQLRSLHSTYRVGQRVALCYVIPDLNQKSRYANASKVRSFFKQVPEQLEDAQTFVASFWYEKKHRATKKGSTPALCS